MKNVQVISESFSSIRWEIQSYQSKFVLRQVGKGPSWHPVRGGPRRPHRQKGWRVMVLLPSPGPVFTNLFLDLRMKMGDFIGWFYRTSQCNHPSSFLNLRIDWWIWVVGVGGGAPGVAAGLACWPGPVRSAWFSFLGDGGFWISSLGGQL